MFENRLIDGKNKLLPRNLLVLDPKEINKAIQKKFIGKEFYYDNMLIGRIIYIDDKGQCQVECYSHDDIFNAMVINEVLEYFEQMNRYQNSKFGIVSKELESLMQDAKTSMKDIFNNIKRKIKK
jgi:hypothetical protein